MTFATALGLHSQRAPEILHALRPGRCQIVAFSAARYPPESGSIA